MAGLSQKLLKDEVFQCFRAHNYDKARVGNDVIIPTQVFSKRMEYLKSSFQELAFYQARNIIDLIFLCSSFANLVRQQKYYHQCHDPQHRNFESRENVNIAWQKKFFQN